MAKPQGGLTKWFKEDWIDLRSGKKCGRSGEEMSTRKYPVCRPKAVAKKMTASEKKSAIARKKGPKPIKYAVSASGKRRKLEIRKA